MDEPSLAESFFKQIMEASDPAKFILDLIDPNQPWFENDWLEFKCAPNIHGDEVKEQWSKALSGFSNTGGGVLIWGIQAKSDPVTKVDFASATCLVNQPAALKSRLMQLHHQATDPPVLDIKVEHIDDPSSNGAGFVVCLIPQSIFRPHRAEYSKRQYYIRAGDDFVVTPVAVLRGLFYPYTVSYLWAEVSVRWNFRGNTNDFGIAYDFRVHNSGTSTAKDVYVVLQTAARFAHLTQGSDWKRVSNPQGQAAFECQRPLHPGTVSNLFIASEASPNERVSSATTVPHHTASFRLLIYASDHEPQTIEIALNEQEVENNVVKKGKPETGHWHRLLP